MNGVLLAVVAAFLFGFAGVVGAQAAKLMNPVLFPALALLISVLLLRGLAFLLKEDFQVKQLSENRGLMSLVLQAAVLRHVVGNILLFFGFSLTSAIKVVFIMGLEPAFVVIEGAVLLKEKVTRQQIGLIALMFFGAFLLSTGGDVSVLSPEVGDTLLVGSLVFSAASYFPVQKAVKVLNATTLIIAVNAIGGVVLLPIAFLAFNVSLSPVASNWVLVAAYVLLFSVFGSYLYYSSLKTAKLWVASSLLRLSPIPGSALAILWLGESLNSIQIIGGLMILITSYFIARLHK